MAVFTILCQRNGGCFGCCGKKYSSPDLVRAAIVKNTEEFISLNPKTDAEYLTFRNRADPSNFRDGVCRNLISEERVVSDVHLGVQFVCPLHPARHNRKDLRVGHCDQNYMCVTAKRFETWDSARRVEFLAYVDSLHLDNVGYSLKMIGIELLRGFEKSKGESIGEKKR